jgi:alkyl hydroperoxide reductase subunit AhpF
MTQHVPGALYIVVNDKDSLAHDGLAGVLYNSDMALLSSENQAEVKKLFEQLSGDVRLLFFTEHDSPLIIPGQDCPTCKDTRTLIEEIAALSDKLHLEIHEVSAGSETAREHGIDRIPALVMTAEGVKGKVRYFGLPSGYEFSVLLGSLIDVSKAQTDLSEETIEVLDALDKDLHFQVFVTPT